MSNTSLGPWKGNNCQTLLQNQRLDSIYKPKNKNLDQKINNITNFRRIKSEVTGCPVDRLRLCQTPNKTSLK